jgi:hypothetical protein
MGRVRVTDSTAAEGRAESAWPLVLVVAAGIAARAWLIATYPIVFGEDTVARLAQADRVMIGHWLPLLQIAIHGLSLASSSPLLVQGFMAVVGALAGGRIVEAVERAERSRAPVQKLARLAGYLV